MISYFDKQLQELERSLHSLDEALFIRWVDEAANTLRNGHKVIVSGLGKNVPVCEKFVGSMVSIGLDACFLHTNSAVHGDMGAAKDGDMVIVLSKSGETEESIYLVRLLKERDVNLWLLTFEKDSTLAQEVPNTVALQLEHEGDLWNIMPNNSTTINLIVLQGLVMMLGGKMEVTLERFRRNHPGGHIGELLTRKDAKKGM